VSNRPKLTEILRFLLIRPRTAAANIKFVTKDVVPASKAFRYGDMASGIRTFRDAVFGPDVYDNLPKLRKAQVHDNLTTVKAELLGPGFPATNSDQVQSVEVPTLLINGKQSIASFHHLIDRFEELMPNTRRILTPAYSLAKGKI
jgi:pimeloyl-ACP methyl ester carboxylesterase